MLRFYSIQPNTTCNTDALRTAGVFCDLTIEKSLKSNRFQSHHEEQRMRFNYLCRTMASLFRHKPV